MKNIFLLLGALFLIYQPSKSQQTDIKFKHISMEEGLSQATVKSILKDRKGYMWFGTRDGLNKYDAYKITIYRHDPKKKESISDNFINDLYEDKEERLWIGTGDGLDLFNRSKDSFNHYKIDAFPLNVMDIFEDSNGNLWLGTHSGLYLFDRSKGTFKGFTHNKQNPNSLINNEINRIIEDNDGQLWIATEGGLDLFNPQKYTFKHYQHNPADSKSIQSNLIKVLYKDIRGNIWIGLREGGIALYNRQDDSFISFKRDPRYLIDPINTNSLPHDDISSISQSEDGRMWIGTENGGLCIFDPLKNIFTTYKPDKNDPNSLSHDAVHSLYRDDQGNMWAGTWAGGVNFYSAITKKFAHFKKFPEAPFNGVEAIKEDREGKVWMGMVQNGLYSFDPKKKIFQYYPNPNKDKFDVGVYWIEELNNDTLVLAIRRGGMAFFDKRTAKFTHYLPDPNDPHSISGHERNVVLVDHTGNIWSGDWVKGLSCFDRKTKKFANYLNNPLDPQSISHNRVFSIIEDKEGYLWIATDGGGVNMFDPSTKKFTHYMHDLNNNHSISNNSVISLLEDAKGNFWVGTGGGGLNLFDRKRKSFTSYTQKDGLPNDVINGMLEDNKGNLWLSTNKGISCFDPQTKKIRNFDTKEGLQDNEFVRNDCAKASDGTMYFAGYNGLNVFHPDSIPVNPYFPPVYITDFQVFNRPVVAGAKDSPLDKNISETKEIILSYNESVFSFEFASLNYILSEKNEYMYRLEGFDKDWNKVSGFRRATYTNLDPGEYTFKVKASNNDGVWNEEGASVHIIITPPFWQTWWFKALVAITIFGSAFSWYRVRINAIKKQKEILEIQVKERTAEVVMQKEELQSQAENLKEANATLIEQKEEILQQQEELLSQTEQIEELYNDLKDSIRAAQEIQNTILPTESYIKQYIPEFFILNKPKDVVSGDFYCFNVIKNKIILAAVDCTGHGVSGAFMSINGHHLLNQAICADQEIVASNILDRLNIGLIKGFHQEDADSTIKDGMDIALCVIDKEKNKLQFAGANNPLYILRNKEIIQVKANNYAIGISVTGKVNTFTNNEIELQKGDVLYIFSDGYADQFGGDQGSEKFKYGRLRELLKKIGGEPMDMQLTAVNEALENWKGNTEQIDDILVMGFKI